MLTPLHPLPTGNTVQSLKQKIDALQKVADYLPGVVIVNDIHTTAVVYMSPRGLSILGTTMAELRNLGSEYSNKYFNPEHAEEYVPTVLGLLERNNNDEIVSFFQQVRPGPADAFSWYLTTIKIFMRNAEGKPSHTISIACPIDAQHHLTTKIHRLYEDTMFIKKHAQLYKKLGKREVEILKMLAYSKSAPEIAAELFLSVATVETHRRNIKQKLEADSAYDLMQYARAFDLL